MNEPLEVVRALYDAFSDQDAERARAVLHPEVRWTQCAGFPGGADRRGAEDVISSVFGGLRSSWRDFRANVEELHAAGATVFVLGRYTGSHGETGRAFESVFAHVYDVEDGRIVRFRQITDTAPMVAALPGSGAAS